MPSDLGPLEPVALLMEMPMLVFYVSVTIFIAAKVRRRSAVVANPFYKLYLTQCVTNYMAYATVGRANNFGLEGWRVVVFLVLFFNKVRPPRLSKIRK